MAGSIRHQLTLMICSLVVLALTSAMMMTYYLVVEDYEEKMQQTNFVMAESLGSNIVQFMQNSYNISALIAKYPDIENLNGEKQHQLLVETANEYTFFQLLEVHHLDGQPSGSSSGILVSRAERWWFKKFIEEKRSYISKTYYSIFSDSPITTINHGVYKDGQLVGLVMADIETSKIQQMVERYNSGAGSYAYLLDGDGVVIAHPDRQQVSELHNYKNGKKIILLRDVNGKVVYDEKKNEKTEEVNFPVPPSLQLIINKVIAGETGVGEYKDLSGEQHICAYRTILLPGNSDPWSLIVVQKKSAALAFFNNMMIKNGIIGMLVISLAGLLTFLFSRRITDPLIDLVRATNKIKEGDLTVRLAVDSSNEIGVLGINFNQMVSELKEQRDGLHQLAFYDALTGLPNRESLNLYIGKEIKKMQGSEKTGAILFVDIDDLKSVNDSFGHSCGDSVIITVAQHIVAAVGDDIFVARSGGDEFSIVLSGKYDREHIAYIADTILGTLCQEYEVAMKLLHMSVSIGVALYPGDSDDVEDLIKKADSAMYAAKRAGRNCWRFYKPIFFEETYEKMMLTNGLRRGLERGEFSLYYQPQLNAVGDVVIGFEALLRWKSPEHGFVSPLRFIPLAEESGLILLIGQWVLRAACQFAKRLSDMGKNGICIAVNISPKQLLEEDFVPSIQRNLQEAGIRPEQLEIEMTESVLIESIEESVIKLSQLRDLGVMLSLDDFGTGYSSLTYLRSLPVGVLKIDKSFIDQIVTDEIQLEMVGSIIKLGHTLGLTIVAEGVESEGQLTLLRQFGCDRIQGYIFSPALPEEDAVEFLLKIGNKL